ncbi:hypothetical protein DMC30DRAFT_447025 [Rhodotorula diobovata]|uniref:Uncharacterized protein n=1 Tax=Rhodotorula diobovata TaxID=5288 RepID=A0A5C5FUF9_9BASI|nr:hypothetical protein DMC30DRAFT_447025 [Rhodotorula diobovata]
MARDRAGVLWRKVRVREAQKDLASLPRRAALLAHVDLDPLPSKWPVRLAHAFNSSAHYLSLTDLSLSFAGKSSIQSSLPRSWAIAEPWRGVRSLPVTSRLTSGHEASLLRALPSVVCLDLFTSLELDWDGKNKVLISTSLVRPRLSVNVTLSAPKMDLHQLALDLSPILASMVCLETLALHDNYGRNQSSLRRLPVSLLQHLPRSLRAATLHLRARRGSRSSGTAYSWEEGEEQD